MEMNKYEGQERRKFKRLRVDFVVNFNVHKPIEVVMKIGNKEIDAVMTDLSEGGMALIADYDIPTSTILSMRFTLFNPLALEDDRVRKLEVIGEVRYNALLQKEEHRLGILFTHIHESDRKAIASFVRFTRK
ncbi:MAG: PilZ domain-containing protein [Candidatus Omnitrophica bacterium]|nr:PilZ domain-containing protein [Candidatus Omnitrophota bacterium]